MPIVLVTPMPAHDDSYGASQYGEYRIIDPTLGNWSKRIPFEGEYGNTVDGEWQPAHPYGRKLCRDSYVVRDIPYNDSFDPPQEEDPQMTSLIAGAVSTYVGESAYDITKRAMYLWLQAERPELAGTFE